MVVPGGYGIGASAGGGAPDLYSLAASYVNTHGTPQHPQLNAGAQTFQPQRMQPQQYYLPPHRPQPVQQLAPKPQQLAPKPLPPVAAPVNPYFSMTHHPAPAASPPVAFDPLADARPPVSFDPLVDASLIAGLGYDLDQGADPHASVVANALAAGGPGLAGFAGATALANVPPGGMIIGEDEVWPRGVEEYGKTRLRLHTTANKTLPKRFLNKANERYIEASIKLIMSTRSEKPKMLTEKTINFIRVRYFRWIVFCDVEVRGCDFVALNHVFHNSQYTNAVVKSGAGFGKS